MKSLKTILLCLNILIVYTGYAQRHIKGQTAVSIMVGAVDNLPTFSASGPPRGGYMGGVDYVWYRKNERYWKTSFTYARKYYEAQTRIKPLIEHYWLSVDYVPRGLYTTRRWLYIAPTAGIYVGYESVNRNQFNIAEGVIHNKSTAAIGPQLGLETEVHVGPSLAMVGGLIERYVPFSEVSQFRTTGYIGIRYCFFR